MEPEGTPARSPPLRCSSEGYPESIRRAWDAKGLYFDPACVRTHRTAVFTVYYLTALAQRIQNSVTGALWEPGMRDTVRVPLVTRRELRVTCVL